MKLKTRPLNSTRTAMLHEQSLLSVHTCSMFFACWTLQYVEFSPTNSLFTQNSITFLVYVARGGRFSDGWGSCERREKRFLKPNHDIPSTAETRAKNRACQVCIFLSKKQYFWECCVHLLQSINHIVRILPS